jgi:hypothetical protein
MFSEEIPREIPGKLFDAVVEYHEEQVGERAPIALEEGPVAYDAVRSV